MKFAEISKLGLAVLFASTLTLSSIGCDAPAPEPAPAPPVEAGDPGEAGSTDGSVAP